MAAVTSCENTLLIYLLVSSMTSSSDILGPLFNCICGRFGDQEMLLAVHFVGKSILQEALKQFGPVASLYENRDKRTFASAFHFARFLR